MLDVGAGVRSAKEYPLTAQLQDEVLWCCGVKMCQDIWNSEVIFEIFVQSLPSAITT